MVGGTAACRADGVPAGRRRAVARRGRPRVARDRGAGLRLDVPALPVHDRGGAVHRRARPPRVPRRRPRPRARGTRLGDRDPRLRRPSTARSRSTSRIIRTSACSTTPATPSASVARSSSTTCDPAVRGGRGCSTSTRSRAGGWASTASTWTPTARRTRPSARTAGGCGSPTLYPGLIEEAAARVAAARSGRPGPVQLRRGVPAGCHRRVHRSRRSTWSSGRRTTRSPTSSGGSGAASP